MRYTKRKIAIVRQLNSAGCDVRGSGNTIAELNDTVAKAEVGASEAKKGCRELDEIDAKTAPQNNEAQTSNSTSSSASCSSISGLPDDGNTATNCLKASGWTDDKPYNQTKTTIKFRTTSGDEIKIPPGFSLWSVAVPSTGSRRLEARRWSGSPRQGKCATERNAENMEFEVSIFCEIGRQATLSNEMAAEDSRFSRREDSSEYIDSFNCKSPRRAEYLEDWQKLPPKYWRDHPDQSVGKCIFPEKNGRRDEKKLREPNWLTAKFCDMLHPNEPIVVNKRGVRGCYVPETN